jgi:hypothetical protein
MKYEREIRSKPHSHHGLWVDVNDVALVDGREFTRSSYACGPDLEKITAEACQKADEEYWSCCDGTPGVICVCGATEFSLSYGSYECIAHCKCGRSHSVYSG